MKYLSDTEILNWNQRLENSPYMVYPASNSQGPHPYIGFNQKTPISPHGPSYNQFVESLDPHIKYDFTFSVIENRNEVFFELFNRLCKEKFGTKTIFKDKISGDIEHGDKIIDSRDVNTHWVSNRSYIRYTYRFNTSLSSIMAYVSYLEDTISFFEKIWGYDENGKEHCLLKYPIGTIVSKEKDKSKDFLVIDYLYEKIGGNYIIDYLACEVVDISSVIIKYGEIARLKDVDLCHSRNNRIDNILN